MARPSAVSSARIKLRNRHLLEWQTLSTLQLTILTSFRQACNQQLSLCSEDKVGHFYLKKQQLTRIADMMVSHRHHRAQLKMRHQRELLLLEQSI